MKENLIKHHLQFKYQVRSGIIQWYGTIWYLLTRFSMVRIFLLALFIHYWSDSEHFSPSSQVESQQDYRIMSVYISLLHLFPLLSLAESQTVKEHVIALLDRHRVVYGDLILTSFDDVFLQENVKSVSLCDTECNAEKKVSCISRLIWIW